VYAVVDFQALENARQLGELLYRVTVDAVAGQYSANCTDTLLTVERVSGFVLFS